ncbi:L-aminoadipate-semialdehyde dehydrogenase-phosphopantetheinyl transferase isoform X1 [Xenopus laevis]|uniref:L-aminoadipate-semialdehyde dehydrogenase-phosphopantetheinyl transferase n=1 Tax=Xenopus laevis TaxID=8355 RepID=A0A8J0UGZ7_XENLA|nr:L-aminoadipate-semialdehyde dehydrogenase-phosphopantetheinyl transferase isoform X1 [Xenopus laevis]
MKLSALKRCVMGSVRWAFQCGSWCPSQAEWLLCARCVQPEEKQRIGHFMFTRDAKAAMAGRLLMRKVIADKLQIPWDRILLERTGKGKPFLTGGSSSEYPCFNFNVSHQGDYAVLAAEPDRQVGVDIMKTDLPGSSSIEEFFRLMNRQFTEKEWNSIRSMNNDWARLDMFYRHWEILLDNQHHVAVALGELDHLQHQSPKIGDVAENTFTLLNFEDLMVSAIPMSDEDPDYWINFQSKQELPFRQRRSR